MRRGVSWAWMLAAALAALLAGPLAQAGGAGQDQAGQQPGQSAQPQNTQKPAANGGNPFPEDEKSVPVMPASNAPEDAAGEGAGVAAPAVDKDPVRSPEDEAPGGGSESSPGFSSSQSGLGNVMSPPPDEPQRKGKHGDDSAIAAFPRETPKEDVDVGTYYMQNHDWKGALSRFQSALVLAPDNPDVYWGLAESERHLGQFAAARGNYQKVVEYDPDSHHAKEAKKALKDPEIANAKAGGPAQK